MRCAADEAERVRVGERTCRWASGATGRSGRGLPAAIKASSFVETLRLLRWVTQWSRPRRPIGRASSRIRIGARARPAADRTLAGDRPCSLPARPADGGGGAALSAIRAGIGPDWGCCRSRWRSCRPARLRGPRSRWAGGSGRSGPRGSECMARFPFPPERRCPAAAGQCMPRGGVGTGRCDPGDRARLGRPIPSAAGPLSPRVFVEPRGAQPVAVPAEGCVRPVRASARVPQGRSRGGLSTCARNCPAGRSTDVPADAGRGTSLAGKASGHARRPCRSNVGPCRAQASPA